MTLPESTTAREVREKLRDVGDQLRIIDIELSKADRILEAGRVAWANQVFALTAALRKALPLLPESEREWAEGALLTAAMQESGDATN